MEQLFDFEKQKVQTLTLDQLERTHKEDDVYGKPLRGIYHYQLINDIIGLCREQSFDTEVYDLFAAQNRDRQAPGVVLLPQVEERCGQRAVEAHILRRVYANVRIKDFDGGGYTTNLAVAFHQRGIQVGFGNNVMVCHNQVMLGAKQYIATYGDKGDGRGTGATIEQVMEAVRGWLGNAREMVLNEREAIEHMKSIEVDAARCYMLIGMLTAMRVAADTSYKEIRDNKTYPLNQSQISRFTELLMLRYHEAERVSVWDIYDTATNLYKANEMEIPSLMPQNRAMVRVLDEQFNLGLENLNN